MLSRTEIDRYSDFLSRARDSLDAISSEPSERAEEEVANLIATTRSFRDLRVIQVVEEPLSNVLGRLQESKHSTDPNLLALLRNYVTLVDVLVQYCKKPGKLAPEEA